MSDRPGERPFWHDAPADDAGDDRGELAPASDAETVTDDHDGEWIEVPHVTVTLSDESGELGTIWIPYDPDNPPPEEDVIADAQQTYFELEDFAARFDEATILRLAQGMEESGTAAAIIQEVARIGREALAIHVTPEDDAPLEEPLEAVEALQQEVARSFHESLPAVLEELTGMGGETPGEFWQDYARDVLAHALLWARDETIEELGESVDQMSDAEFDAAAIAAYENGPYITRAMVTLTSGRVDLLTSRLIAFLEQENESPDKVFYGKIVEQAREKIASSHPPASSMPPAFENGYGRVHNDPVSAGARLMLVSSWSGLRNAYPVFNFGNAAGNAIYAPSEKTYPTAADAWKAVERYDDAHVDLFDYILAKMLASKASNQRDIYGDFRLTPEEVLDARGIAKHVKGGHKPENIREIIRQINDLASIEVRAQISGHTQGGKGKRGKRETITLEHAVELIAIHETLYEVSLTGERVPIAWQLRPGNWARELERFTPQYAVMMQGILKLHARRDANAKRIGRYLVYQYRIRAHERSWAQPYRICDLLASAGIEVDRSNPGRFRRRIEAALDVLANPSHMRGPVCIKAWHYPNPAAASGRGWLDDWLESGIVILPPDELTKERYQAIGARKRRRQQPRKLANGDTK